MKSTTDFKFKIKVKSILEMKIRNKNKFSLYVNLLNFLRIWSFESSGEMLEKMLWQVALDVFPV